MNSIQKTNMAIKVVFIGNIFGGDDGIGPYLFLQLKDEAKLKTYELSEEGVIGFDLITLVEEGDQLIVVDAVKTEKDDEVGKVIVLEEEDLETSPMSLISQHDFGVEETAKMIRTYKPGVKKINVVGILVKDVQPFSEKLSKNLMLKIEDIKKQVVDSIIEIAEE